MEGELGGSQLKKGLWTVEEDKLLMDYVTENGKGKWNSIAKRTGCRDKIVLFFNMFSLVLLCLFEMNSRSNHNGFVMYRIEKMWKELQVEVDELPEPECQARSLY